MSDQRTDENARDPSCGDAVFALGLVPSLVPPLPFVLPPPSISSPKCVAGTAPPRPLVLLLRPPPLLLLLFLPVGLKPVPLRPPRLAAMVVSSAGSHLVLAKTSSQHQTLSSTSSLSDGASC